MGKVDANYPSTPIVLNVFFLNQQVKHYYSELAVVKECLY